MAQRMYMHTRTGIPHRLFEALLLGAAGTQRGGESHMDSAVFDCRSFPAACCLPNLKALHTCCARWETGTSSISTSTQRQVALSNYMLSTSHPCTTTRECPYTSLVCFHMILLGAVFVARNNRGLNPKTAHHEQQCSHKILYSLGMMYHIDCC